MDSLKNYEPGITDLILVAVFVGIVYLLDKGFKYLVRKGFNSFAHGPVSGEIADWPEVETQVSRFDSITDPGHFLSRMEQRYESHPRVIFNFPHPDTGKFVSSSAIIPSDFSLKKGDKIKIKFNPEKPSEAVVVEKL